MFFFSVSLSFSFVECFVVASIALMGEKCLNSMHFPSPLKPIFSIQDSGFHSPYDLDTMFHLHIMYLEVLNMALRLNGRGERLHHLP